MQEDHNFLSRAIQNFSLRKPQPINISSSHSKRKLLYNQPTLMESLMKVKQTETMIVIIFKVNDVIEDTKFQPVVIKVKSNELPSDLKLGLIHPANVVKVKVPGLDAISCLVAAKGESGQDLTLSYKQFQAKVKLSHPSAIITRKLFCFYNCDGVQISRTQKTKLETIETDDLLRFQATLEGLRSRKRSLEDLQCGTSSVNNFNRDLNRAFSSENKVNGSIQQKEELNSRVSAKKHKTDIVIDVLDEDSNDDRIEVMQQETLQNKANKNDVILLKQRDESPVKRKVRKIPKKEPFIKKEKNKKKDDKEKQKEDSFEVEKIQIASHSTLYESIRNMKYSILHLQEDISNMAESASKSRWESYVTFSSAVQKFCEIVHFKLVDKFYVPEENRTRLEGKYTIIEGELPLLTSGYNTAKSMPGSSDPMTLLGNIIRQSFPSTWIELTSLAGTAHTYSIAQTFGFPNPLEEPYKGQCDEEKGEIRVRALLDHVCRLCGYKVYDTTFDDSLRTKISKVLYAERKKRNEKKRKLNAEEDAGSEEEEEIVSSKPPSLVKVNSLNFSESCSTEGRDLFLNANKTQQSSPSLISKSIDTKTVSHNNEEEKGSMQEPDCEDQLDDILIPQTITNSYIENDSITHLDELELESDNKEETVKSQCVSSRSNRGTERITIGQKFINKVSVNNSHKVDDEEREEISRRDTQGNCSKDKDTTNLDETYFSVPDTILSLPPYRYGSQ